MISRRAVLTSCEFDVLWEGLGLGPTPVVLRLPSPGCSTVAERGVLDATGWQGLCARGLAGPSGPDPELVRLLRLLARPVEQLELRAWAGRSVRAAAGGGTEERVLAVRQDSTITLSWCGSLASGLVGVLPMAGPGTGRACTLPTAALAAALGMSCDLRESLVAHQVPDDDAAVLAGALGSSVYRAQIVALAADPWGVLRRSGGVLGVLDGPRGRYVLTRSVGDDGVEWSTVAPADVRTVRHRVAELVDAARLAAGGASEVVEPV